MKRPTMPPPQISILLLLTLGIVGTYLVIRHFLTPESFGQYGWYRGKALEEIASQEPVLAGMQSCNDCHSEILKQILGHEHKTVSCESCHGASKAHAENPEIATERKLDDAFCLRCHDANPSRPDWISQIKLADHYVGSACIECHMPHQPNEVPP